MQLVQAPPCSRSGRQPHLGAAWRSHQRAVPTLPLGQALGHVNSGGCHFNRGSFSVPVAETADVAASTPLPRGKSGRIQKSSKESEVFTVLGWLWYSTSILFPVA